MSKKIIESAYELIAGLTPLKSDCGMLCDSACCKSRGYMVLFPNEKELMDKHFDVSVKQLPNYGAVYSAVCEGNCNRQIRPLSCRIFPLAPKVIDGMVYVRLDPRARNVCPLSHKSILSLDSEFINTIKKMFNMLYKDDEIKRFIGAISDIADEYNDILKFK
jgi:hypothetical protein